MLGEPIVLQTPPAGGAVWRIELLGTLRAIPPGETQAGGAAPGEAVEHFRTHKVVLLLARLALFPKRAHARDELAEWLWPDAPADRGRASLTQALVQLRAALHQPRVGGLFMADHKTVRVDRNALETDVAEWEAAACRALETAFPEAAALVKTALALYPGDLLPGFYDGWVCDERSRLADLHHKLEVRLQKVEAVPPFPPAAAAETAEAEDSAPVLTNAPLFLTQFFGRETECAQVCDLLTQTPPARLVTLRGMGGIGKTRLAVEAAQLIVGIAPSPFTRAVFVSLDAAQTTEQMESVLLSGLGIQTKESDFLAAVAQYLTAALNHRRRTDAGGPDRFLLVLDNLEQLGGNAAPVVARLLALVPRLTVLATSRQPIGIAGEREIALGPLRGGAASSADTLPDDARLFVDRACLARPALACTVDTPENREAVRALCDVLEGIPLALELAAAWVRVLTLSQILERLSQRFDLLTLRGASTAASTASTSPSKRHQSLCSAIAWSYDLLSPELQTVWAQLSVFRGGWTTEAAQAVTGIKSIDESLLLLAERSLLFVEANETTGQIRYRMPESLREFADARARASEVDFCTVLFLRHAEYFDRLSREANAMTRNGQGMRPALALLGPERDNLRVVFARLQEAATEAVTESDRTPDKKPAFLEAAIQSIVQSVWLWQGEANGYIRLAARAAAILPDGGVRPLRASVLAMQGRNALLAGDDSTAERHLRESLALWREVGNEHEAVVVNNHLAAQAGYRGDFDTAFAIFMESLRFAQKTNNLRLESAMLSNLAIVGPDLAQRRAWSERAVYLDRTHWPGSTFHACSLQGLGSIALLQKDRETARACFEEAHTLAVADGHAGMMGVAKSCLAEFFHQGYEALDRAEQLLREAQTLYEAVGEYPRIASTLRERFQIALKRGEVTVGLACARDYLSVNREAHLMDAAGLVSAQADLTKYLREAGYNGPFPFAPAQLT